MNLEFKEANVEDVFGTSFHYGYVENTAYEIEKVLGKCSYVFDDGKTQYEWDKNIGSITFTIYDYKSFPAPYQVYKYHIGTKCKEDTMMVVALLKEAGLNAIYEQKF